MCIGCSLKQSLLAPAAAALPLLLLLLPLLLLLLPPGAVESTWNSFNRTSPPWTQSVHV